MREQNHFCEYSLASATYALPVFFLDAGESTVARWLSSFLLTRSVRQLKRLGEALTPSSRAPTILPEVHYPNLDGA
jgi:hypothetical protein